MWIICILMSSTKLVLMSAVVFIIVEFHATLVVALKDENKGNYLR